MRRTPRDRTPKPRWTLTDGPPAAFAPIGVIASPFRWREEAPRQATIAAEVEAVITLRAGMQNTLKDLAGFERIWVLFWCNYSNGWSQQVVPPRDTVKRGVLATRSPDRPNPIGLSAVRLVSVRGVRVTVRGVDMLDGTPVLDLKPYIPAYDAFPDARAGWVDALSAPGPDHRRT